MKKQLAANMSAAIYCRLSRDDENVGESESIQNQRAMLTDYANSQGFTIYSEYCDDGYSGLNFERPNFKRMMADIENGHVNCVLVKDCSRLGRNFVLTGELTEIVFPMKGIRFIAVCDGHDSFSGENDITAFRHILNEMVAKDTSKKVRAAFEVKKKNGMYFAEFAPYGYQKDPENKGKLIVDGQAAEIVRRMFYLASIGYGSRKIRNIFNEEGILAPAVYRSTQHTHIPDGTFTKSHKWSDQVVADMLRSTVYLGDLNLGKSEKPSFKLKKVIQKPQDEWIVHHNAHEPIIERDTWELVQKKMSSRYREKQFGINIFAGIAFCADCGYVMGYKAKTDNSLISLACSNYGRNGKTACTNHLVNYDALYELMLEQIRNYARLALEEQEQLMELLMQKTASHDSRQLYTIKEDLKTAEKRYMELDTLFMRLYEDNVAGKIKASRYGKMSAIYEQEQEELEKQIDGLKSEVADFKDTGERRVKWLNLIKKYANIEELDKCIINELVERIEVGQGQYEYNGCRAERKKYQEIKIYYRFVGKID